MAYIVSGTDLTSVANAIRTKGGTSAQLEFPSGFVTAIGNIPSGGGASNFVSGSFTGIAAEKGTAKAVSVDYSGNGYPVSVLIYPKGGYKDGSTLYTSTAYKATIMFAMTKSNTGETPAYDTSNTEKNFAFITNTYKNSSSDSNSVAASVSKGKIAFTSYNPSSTDATNVVRMSSKNTLNVFIRNSDYGFLDGVEYAYEIVYSE